MSKLDEAIFQGSRLRLARTFHGLTLAELGEQVSASRQYMQRLEGDPGTYPSKDMLYALAEILYVEPSFFFEPLVGEVSEEECHFRKLKTTPQNIRSRALSYGTIFNQIILYLEQALELPAINIPKIKVETREDVERAAENCRKHWKLYLDAPINNMTRTLEHAGCIVTTFNGVSEKIDAFSYFRTRPIVVRNTAKSSTSRFRFDLAHELGHLVMHNDVEVGDPALEEQANHFASAFLLPRVAFIQEFPKSNRVSWSDFLQIKKRWGVSVQAIIRRAYDLGLINAVQYRNANVYISRNNKRRDEGPETEPKQEPMEIIPVAFEQLGNTYGITAANVATKLGLKCLILERFGIFYDNSQPANTRENIIYLEEHRIIRKR
ncbi:MAG: ImmA/IrrE family metallo-endopeptidase [Alphaproteobacteria bacterium]|uniref:ImmA/IrrE family metallo-endopeptidase n=1 Tax=Candidatus Nitrobium versatile TaxID=2884831 RepID=A0A953SI69_9BACT|nr:ImmA/IrrE family metallo-endopeptidase [Candidatus Nitrobium versatile]